MPLFTLDELAAAAQTVRAVVPATPAYAWPLLAKRTGVEVVVKHENHTPTGSFKVRGGLVYVDHLLRTGPAPAAVTAADTAPDSSTTCTASLRIRKETSTWANHSESGRCGGI